MKVFVGTRCSGYKILDMVIQMMHLVPCIRGWRGLQHFGHIRQPIR